MDTDTPDLAIYRGWLHAVANGLLAPGHPDHDDLVAEGWVAMWKALDRIDLNTDPGPYLRAAARYRMLDVVTHRRPLTGDEGRTAGREYGQVRGDQTRDRIRAHLREHPTATGTQTAQALGLSPATVSYHRARLTGTDTPPDVVSTDVWEHLDGTAPDTLDAVEWAYHHGEIAQAINALPEAQRRYCVLRFWGGYSHSELAAEYGYAPHGLWRLARKALAGRLEHLATV